MSTSDKPASFSAIPVSGELFFESSPDCVKVLDAQGHLLAMNRNGRCLMEVDDFNQLCGASWHSFWPEESQDQIRIALETARKEELGQFVAFCPTAKGTPKWWDVRVTAIRDSDDNVTGFLSLSRDLTALHQLSEQKKREERFASGQKHVLELAVKGAPIEEILEALIRTAEEYSGYQMLASVLLTEEDQKHLRLGAAPSLPDSYNQALGKVGIGPEIGCCGTAAYTKKQVFSKDIQSDPKWAAAKELASSHGLAACWSYPILSSQNVVLGTFAFYFREVREITELEKQAMPLLIHTAALVLERHQESRERKAAEDEFKKSDAKFRTITNAMPLMVWSTLPNGHAEYFNQQWYAFTGLPEGSTDGEAWSCALHPEDRERTSSVWRRSLETGEPYEIEYRLKHHSGEYRWALGRALPVRDEQGSIIRWMGTCTDINEQKRAAEALKESSRRKDEFLAMLAHELRNPLAPITAAAELLGMVEPDEEQVREISQVISRQANHMTGLIEDLLDVSRVTRGLVTLDKKPVDLKAIIAEALEQIQPLVEERHHQLATHVSAESMLVAGDKKRLVQIVANVVGNAAKYTPHGGHITLRMTADESNLIISVRDNGIGMSPNLIQGAFDLFRQGERTADRAQGGLGIGLALVKSLVHLHGGDIWAYSDGPGSGSEFVIHLPRMEHSAEFHRSRFTKQAVSSAGNALRILIVDDNTDAARLLAMLLETRGHIVHVEYQASKAIETARRVAPNVCLLDIGMPDMDGHELVKRLNSLPEVQPATKIAVTGYGQAQDRNAAFAVGFDHHFVKPVDTQELVLLLDSLAKENDINA